ncbi:MAG: amidohydrolase family protein, partial [Deltaproteobacteria bacterium]|nr:amidohydrolase family protein [Deltaproteobacteria bacterium]
MKRTPKAGTVRLFTNARIHSHGDKRTEEALACDVFSGTILAVGKSKELMSSYKSLKPEIIDLQGMTVLPGFTDCHTHFCGYSLMLTRPNLDGIGSLKGCQEKVFAYLKGKRPGQWIIGTGWNK